MPWGATIDGVLLQDLPLNVIAAGKSNPVDGVIMGTNHDEGTIFVARLAKVVPGVHTPMIPSDLALITNHFWGNNATVNNMITSMYDINNYPNATVQTEVMLRDFFFLCPTSRAMLAMEENSNSPAYVYQFVYKGDWIESLSMGVSDKQSAQSASGPPMASMRGPTHQWQLAHHPPPCICLFVLVCVQLPLC